MMISSITDLYSQFPTLCSLGVEHVSQMNGNSDYPIFVKEHLKLYQGGSKNVLGKKHKQAISFKNIL